MYFKKSITYMALLISFITFINISGQYENSDLDSNTVYEKEYIFDIYFINGYALGYKLFSYSDSEIRLIIDVSSSYNKETENRTSSSSTNGFIPPNQSTDSENGLTSINLSTQYLLNIYKSKFGESYFGIGPFIGYQRYNYLHTQNENNYESESISKRNEFSIGLTAIVGIRSKLNKTISIYAETQLSGGLNWENGDNENNNRNNGILENNYKGEFETDGWYYNLTYVRIGIRFQI